MPLQRLLPQILILTLVLGATSCNDDWLRSEYDTTIQWEGGIEGPLVFGHFILEDIIEQLDSSGYVFMDEDSLLWASYSVDTVLTAPDVLEIPDQEFIQVLIKPEFDIPGAALAPLGSIHHYEETKGFEFERMGDERLDSVHIKEGNMQIFVQSTIKHAGTLTISSEDVAIDGNDFLDTIMISDPSGTYIETFNISMDGAAIILDNSDPDTTSLLMLFEFDLVNSGADILTTEELRIEISFQDLVFQGAYGYIGQYDTVLFENNELEFDLLEGAFEGSVKLADPQLRVEVNNSMGIPFEIDLSGLKAYFKDDSDQDIFFNDNKNTIEISAPNINQIGTSVLSELNIDNANSNIHVAATTDLAGLQYSVGVRANPPPFDPLTDDNFVLDTSKMAISLEGLIPLELRITDVVFRDTFEFDLFTVDDESDFGPGDIDSVRIEIETRNHLPLDLGLQVYFVDTTQNWLKLDSLFDGTKYVLRSGQVNTEGEVTANTMEITRVELTGQQIENILDANKLLIEAYLDTHNSATNDVKFLAGDYLGFNLRTRLKLNITLESEPNN